MKKLSQIKEKVNPLLLVLLVVVWHLMRSGLLTSKGLWIWVTIPSWKAHLKVERLQPSSSAKLSENGRNITFSFEFGTWNICCKWYCGESDASSTVREIWIIRDSVVITFFGWRFVGLFRFSPGSRGVCNSRRRRIVSLSLPRICQMARWREELPQEGLGYCSVGWLSLFMEGWVTVEIELIWFWIGVDLFLMGFPNKMFINC